MNFYLEFCINRSTLNENLNTNNLLSICTKKNCFKDDQKRDLLRRNKFL